MRVLRPVFAAAAWIPVAAAVLFAAYAASFLYFFVDDEAIPLVYAQNLDKGRGLIYNTLEGRVEGYSDFLYVVTDTVLLRAVRVLGLPKLTVLQVGKAISFLLGIGIIVLTARALRRAGATPPGLASGLLFLALAGPLAVWSCSALEAVPFSFTVLALASWLFIATGDHEDAAAGTSIALAALVILGRIDGFVYVAVLLVAASVAADAARRRWLFRKVILPVIGVATAYHAARFLFFGSLLSAPLEAKVLYKLSPAARAIVKAPERGYVRAFIDLYGVALVPALALAAMMAWRTHIGRAAVIAAVGLIAYVGVVGDWMFGWRFLVPILPLLAIVIGCSVSRVKGPLAWVTAAVVVAWSATAAYAFAGQYVVREHRPLWWTNRGAGTQTWLFPYGDLLTLARGAVAGPSPRRFAYNQAGLLPYLLDVDNIDDLGICSRFVAGLPTTDVYFTEVGRYSPLTNAPVLRAAHAYLLYRDVQVIASRTDLLAGANGGRVPHVILNDYFRLKALDASGENALYVRTEKPANRYRSDPSLFQENLAHVSRVRRAEVDGERLTEEALGPRLPFLRDQTGGIPVTGRAHMWIQFADRDEVVAALYVAALSAPDPMTVVFALYDTAGHRVGEVTAATGQSTAAVIQPFDGVRASLLAIDVQSSVPTESRLTVGDLRVQGQSAALRDYVRGRLRFPAP